jgi:hypothetical protein
MLSGMIILLSGMIIMLSGMIIMMSRMIIMLCGMNACAALGRVHTLGPELHKDLSTLHSPVLHLNLTWTWTLLISTLARPLWALKPTLEVFSQPLRALPWPLHSTSIATAWADTLRPLQAVSWLVSNLTASTCTFTVIQSFSRLYSTLTASLIIWRP